MSSQSRTEKNKEVETRNNIIQNLSKLSGGNFNIQTMTKQEIASKFDKHAPHWKHFVSIAKYSIFDWMTEQCRIFVLKNKNNVRILGILHFLLSLNFSYFLLRSWMWTWFNRFSFSEAWNYRRHGCIGYLKKYA